MTPTIRAGSSPAFAAASSDAILLPRPEINITSEIMH